MAFSRGKSDEFPSELNERLSNFDDSLSKVEDIVKVVHDQPIGDLHAKVLLIR